MKVLHSTNMRVLTFDVETTGLLPKNKNKENYANFPYITQMSFAMYDTDANRMLSTYNAYVKIPDNVELSEKVRELTGVSRELLDDEGVSIVNVLQTLYYAYSICDVIVGHNMEGFDSVMVEAEAHRNYALFDNIETATNTANMFRDDVCQTHKVAKFCTMKNSIDLCNILRTNSRGQYKKYPTLCELYEKLFDVKPDNLHNSMIDVLVCLRCYLMIRHKITVDDGDFELYVRDALRF